MGISIKEKARNKIWSKYIQCENEIKRLEYDIDKGFVGGVTLDELKSVLEHVRDDYLIYSHIYTLLEKE